MTFLELGHKALSLKGWSRIPSPQAPSCRAAPYWVRDSSLERTEPRSGHL